LEKDIMLFNTLSKSKYNYSGDYYGYTKVTSADGSVTENVYDEVPQQFKMSLSTSFIGDIIILTDSKLQQAGYISNITDRNGAEIYTDGLWEIRSTQPLVNALGIVEGYKYKAKIISGNV
jgi:hypothetical protein